MKISVVTPLYKSAPYIEALYERLVAAIAETGADEYEIVFVNDHSPDDDLAVAKRLADRDRDVIVIDLSRNFGQHKAILTGLGRATGDFVFVLDSDLEDEPEWVGLFYAELRRTGCDAVFGVQKERPGRPIYSLCRQLFYKALVALSGIDFPRNVVMARLMTRRYVDALMQYEEREVFMLGIWHMVGFAQCPVEVAKQTTSPTTYNSRRLVALFLNAVTAFSTRPLIAISLAGVALSAVAIVYSGWVVFQKLFHGVAVPGWTSVMAATLLIGGITLFFNGIIAIYIAKIFVEVKRRPLSTIREVYKGDGESSPAPPAAKRRERSAADVE